MYVLLIICSFAFWALCKIQQKLCNDFEALCRDYDRMTKNAHSNVEYLLDQNKLLVEALQKIHDDLRRDY